MEESKLMNLEGDKWQINTWTFHSIQKPLYPNWDVLHPNVCLFHRKCPPPVVWVLVILEGICFLVHPTSYSKALYM